MTGITTKSKREHNNNKLTLGFWNVQGLNKEGKFKQLLKEAKEYKLDILAVQETNIKGISSMKVNEYLWFNGGGDMNRFGTGFLIKEHFKNAIMDYKVINERISYLRLRGNYRKISIINVHAPTEDAEEEKKNEFYEDIETLTDSIPRFDVKIIIGDLNAKIGKEEWNHMFAGRESLHETTNKNGQKLISLAALKNMIIKSTSLKRKNIFKGTWKSPDKKTINQIDHLITDKIHAECVENVRTYRGADINSDHFLVRAKIRQEIPKLRQQHKSGKRKWDVQGLNSEYEREQYSTSTKEELSKIGKKDDIQGEWEFIKETITRGAEKLRPKTVNKDKDWFDEECGRAMEERKKARIELLQGYTKERDAIYKKARNKAHETCRKKKRQRQKEKFEEIEQQYYNNNTRKLYENLKKQKVGHQEQSLAIKDKNGDLCIGEKEISEAWANHFEEILSEHPTITTRLKAEVYKEEDKTSKPTQKEIQDIVKELKNNKSAGPDGLEAELLKHAGDELIKRLHQLILEIWEKQEMPNEWYQAIICPIPKKGNKQIMGNYRPISILNVAYKILAHVIKRRIQEEAEKKIGHYQAGFQKGKSTIDNIFIMRQIQEKCKKKDIKIHVLLIDFRQAYDKIKRGMIQRALKELKFKQQTMDLVEVTLLNTSAQVGTRGAVSRRISTGLGLKQGDPMSPILFNIVLEHTIRESKINTKYNIVQHSYQCLAYADDLIIMAKTKEELKGLSRKLEDKAKIAGLIINEEKTNYMILGNRRQEINQYLVIKSIKDEKEYKFKCVNSAVYLGVEINSEVT